MSTTIPIFPVQNLIRIPEIKGNNQGPEYKTSFMKGSFPLCAEPSNTVRAFVVFSFSRITASCGK